MQADRAQAVAALAAAQERHAALTAECAKHAASDPEVIARIAGMKKSALEAANRWTDNRASPHSACGAARTLTSVTLQCLRSRTGL